MFSIQALQDWAEDAVANLPFPARALPVTVLEVAPRRSATWAWSLS
jgi:hypothetical protein